MDRPKVVRDQKLKAGKLEFTQSHLIFKDVKLESGRDNTLVAENAEMLKVTRSNELIPALDFAKLSKLRILDIDASGYYKNEEEKKDYCWCFDMSKLTKKLILISSPNVRSINITCDCVLFEEVVESLLRFIDEL